MLKKKRKQVLAVILAAMCYSQPIFASEMFTDNTQLFSSGEREAEELEEEREEAVADFFGEDLKTTENSIVCTPKNGTKFNPILPKEYESEWDDGDIEENPHRDVKITNRGNKPVKVNIEGLKKFFLMIEKYDIKTGDPEEFSQTKILEPGKYLCIRVYCRKSEGVFKENLKIKISDGTTLRYTISQDCPENIDMSMKQPIIRSVKEESDNILRVNYQSDITGTEKYQIVAAKSLEELKNGEYCFDEQDNVFHKVEKGTYYFAMRTYEYRNGKKTYSEWSEPVKAIKKARLPGKAVIKSVKIKGTTVQVVLEKSRNCDGYDGVLANYNSYGRPYEYLYVIKNKKQTTLTFKNVKPGIYYVGVHGYNRDFTVNFKHPKAFGEWSDLKKIRVR